MDYLHLKALISLDDFTPGSVEALYKKTDEQGNILYFVETACEGDYKICGWISEKDLEHVDVGP